MTSIQLVTWACPSIISNPAGVCIHELSTIIQNADRLVPKATNAVDKVCSHGGTRLLPNNMMPRKVASRKNAVSTS